MPGTRQYHWAKGMRWTARIIGLLAACFILFMIIGTMIFEFTSGAWETASQTDIIQGSMIGVLGALGLAGSIVSLWHERLGSLLLILTAIGFGIHIGICAGRNHFLVWLMIGLPYLLAGGLLFAAQQLTHPANEEQP